VLGAMPTAAVGMFFRENNGMATLRGHGTRYTDDETALEERNVLLRRSRQSMGIGANRHHGGCHVVLLDRQSLCGIWGKRR
jgi:hypothetical protein